MGDFERKKDKELLRVFLARLEDPFFFSSLFHNIYQQGDSRTRI